MKQLLLFLGFLFCQMSFSQSQQEDLSVGLGAVTIPHFNKQRVGIELSARYYFTDAFSAGGYFYTASPKFNHGFGFDTDRTLMNIYAITIPLQYDVINTEKLTLGLGFSNGLLLNVLRNRNDVKEEIYYDDDTGIGYASKVPQRLKTDSYYLLTPYADFSYRVMAVDREKTGWLFLSAKVGYQNAFGNGTFSNSTDFRNYIVSFGITIKGTTN